MLANFRWLSGFQCATTVTFWDDALPWLISRLLPMTTLPSEWFVQGIQ